MDWNPFLVWLRESIHDLLSLFGPSSTGIYPPFDPDEDDGAYVNLMAEEDDMLGPS